MKLSEGDELDDALELFHSHQWREYKPQISAEQMAELIPVLAPLFQQSRPRVRRERPTQKVQNGPRPKTSGSSSHIPKRIRDAVLARDNWSCQRCGVSLHGRFYSLQHRDNRGMGGSKTKHTMANLVALCGSGTTGCHGHVESEPNESDRLGWSVPNGAIPEKWPVFRFDRSWEQPGETGWEKTQPHERQIEMGAAA